MQVVCRHQEWGFSVVEWAASPWQNEMYLGHMLSRQAALSSSYLQTFFHIADHVMSDLPEVQKYFAGPN
jgi:hypothetical protein